MPVVQDVLDLIEEIAPSRFAYSFDRIGLQIGDPSAITDKVVVALDPTLAAVEFCIAQRAQMLVCHHPVIWDPIKSLVPGNYKTDIALALVKSDTAFACAHTNWDCAPGGINDVLAEVIGLSEVRAVGSQSDKEQFKIVVFVPDSAAQAVIEAMAQVGAGRIGEYERCATESLVTGTFRGRPGTNPTIGQAGQIERVEERRIEMVCPAERLAAAVGAMKRVHPYEEPAYDVVPVKQPGGHPICRIGILPGAMTPKEFEQHLDRTLNTKSLLCSPPDKKITTVVVCGGAAADEWQTAQEEGADAFVTGEVPHHLMVEASERGLAIAAAGHYATENPGTMRLAELLGKHVQVTPFEPKTGESGRPN